MKRKLTAFVLALMMCLAVFLPVTAELIKFGDTGSQVGLLELKLKDLNYYNGAIDSKFGYELYLAVRAYQKNNGLKVDGVAGPETLGALGIGEAQGVPNDPAVSIRLTYGSTGGAVVQLQDRLRALGYFTAASDGKFYDSTYYAVIAFQKNNYLKADGIVGEATWARLFSVNAIGKVPSQPTSVLRLKYSDRGPQVTQVQQRLTALKYFTRTVDGVYGYYTYLCVRAFQERNKLKVDGVVGPLTWGVLMSADAVPAASGTAPSDPSAPFRLQYRDKGPDVLALQNRLAALGYYAGAKDSVFNYTLYLSVRKFQRINGLTVDGVVGPKTWTLLMSADAKPMTTATPDDGDPAPAVFRLQYEDKGPDVLAVQQRLTALKYYTGALDSVFNYTLYTSVRRFQRINGLTIDGVIGEKTWNRMMSPDAVPYTE